MKIDYYNLPNQSYYANENKMEFKQLNKSIIIDLLDFNEVEQNNYIINLFKDNSIDNYIEGIAAFDKDGGVKLCNQKFSKILDDLYLGKNLNYSKDCNTLDNINSLFHNKNDRNANTIIMEDFILRRFQVTNSNEVDISMQVILKIFDLFKIFDINYLQKIFKKIFHLSQINIESNLLLDSIFDLVTVTDSDGIILRTNSKVEREFGISKEDIIGMSIYDLEKKGILSNSITKEIINKKTNMTLTQDTKEGRRLVVTGTPIFDSEGNIYRIFNISKDITEINALNKKLHENEQLMSEYKKQLSILQGNLDNSNLLITSSIKMKSMLELVNQIANVDSTVLIQGETGVGKGVLANTIHNISLRKSGPFIKINCATIPENLIESELFGYEKGSFTGALNNGKQGLLSLANNGTLFLDEIGDLPLAIQLKILDLIQNKSYYPVGGTNLKTLDVRIIAATNKDLKALVYEGKFREDLYYRLNVIPIYIPPLRERIDEIPILINSFLDKFCTQYNREKILCPDCMNILVNATWPGNIRELENMIERLVVTTPGTVISAKDIPKELYSVTSKKEPIEIIINELVPIKNALDKMENEIYEKAFEMYSNYEEISDILGVHRTTVYRKKNAIKRFD